MLRLDMKIGIRLLFSCWPKIKLVIKMRLLITTQPSVLCSIANYHSKSHWWHIWEYFIFLRPHRCRLGSDYSGNVFEKTRDIGDRELELLRISKRRQCRITCGGWLVLNKDRLIIILIQWQKLPILGKKVKLTATCSSRCNPVNYRTHSISG